MAIDTSIYSNVQPVQIQQTNPLDSAYKAMTIGNMGLQQQAQQRQLQNQQAMADAYTKNMKPDGSLDQQGYLSELGRTAPIAAMEAGPRMMEMRKQAAEAQTAELQAANQTLTTAMPVVEYLKKLPADQAAMAYPDAVKQLKSMGVNTGNMPSDYDSHWLDRTHEIMTGTKQYVENQLAQSTIAKNYSEVGQMPAKLNSELYGSRSPNAELSSQYDKQAAPIRGSQVAMNQMIDNYKNPNPQGDKSLVLNALKIKFPGLAPDVNSLEEISKSQSLPDQWKQLANKALAGGLDQATRDNLLRDGISTYRANVNTLQGIQQRFNTRAQIQNVKDPSLTYEPAINQTYNDAMTLQKQIGPYVPPAERGGILGSITGPISKFLGAGSGTANAASSAPKPQAGATPPGMIKMIKNGQVKLVPNAMKGEAIASGASVVE